MGIRGNDTHKSSSPLHLINPPPPAVHRRRRRPSVPPTCASMSGWCVESGNQRFGGRHELFCVIGQLVFLVFFFAYVELIGVFWISSGKKLQCSPYLRAQVQHFQSILLSLCTKLDIHPVRLTPTYGWKLWLDLRTMCIITTTSYAMLMTYCAYTMTLCQLWTKSMASFPWNPVLWATQIFTLALSWNRLDYPMG